MSWKLWLDDQMNDPVCPERHVPEGFIGADGTSAGIELVKKNGIPGYIDFDYDLGGVDTASSFIIALQQMFPKGPVPNYRVHSRNPFAKADIDSLMNFWKKSISL